MRTRRFLSILPVWWMLMFCCALLCSCFGTGTYPKKLGLDVEPVFRIQSIEDLYRLFTYDEQRYPLISAHRGGSYPGYPENALETFAFIAQQMPTIIECDVRMTKDSILVLLHDKTLQRTTTGKGELADKTFAELQDLFLVDKDGVETPYKIPQLDEVLTWGKERVIYTLDVKRDVPYDMVVESIRKTQSERFVIIITYNATQAGAVNRLAPELLISASIRQDADLTRLSAQGIPDNRMLAFIGTTAPDSLLVAQLHLHGIKTILGTMGNLDRQAEAIGSHRYTDLIDRGVDILSTDRPLEAYEAVRKYSIENHLKSPYISH